MNNGAQIITGQHLKDAIVRSGRPVRGFFFVDSAEARLAPFADSKRPEKANELVAQLSRQGASHA